jgi:hypothetical protein
LFSLAAIQITEQFQQVLDFVNRTREPIFLTGKAGTGKTTLLKYVREKTYKQIAIVAPTGVAAINAGGSTIHSFFQFPFTPFLPLLKYNGEVDMNGAQLPTLKYNSQRLAIFRNLELLVIDEISMVRCDLLDQIDLTLRFTRKKSHLPFGGVQVLMIGDMYQLPPVVGHEEWQLLKKVYQTQYFFDSLVVRKHPPIYFELDKIFRQNEQSFVDLLNKVRNNMMDSKSLDLLNSHYSENATKDEQSITLTTHNRKADEINSRKMDALPGKKFVYKAKVEGNFSEKNFPAEEDLTLKVGAKVMFLKNNQEKDYFNGKIGYVTRLEDEKVFVKCEADRFEIEVGRDSWSNIAYRTNKNSSQIEEEILGTFSQLPLRLAWAITIHKSQGLTFDKVVIDAAEAFSAGQVYVALSRCRSLSGLTLSSKIQLTSLYNDQNIIRFSDNKKDAEHLKKEFDNAEQNFLKQTLLDVFNFSELQHLRQQIASVMVNHKTRLVSDGIKWLEQFLQSVDETCTVADKFGKQLQAFFADNITIVANSVLDVRVQKASVYFDGILSQWQNLLLNLPFMTESKIASTEMSDLLKLFYKAAFIRQTEIGACAGGYNFSKIISARSNLKIPEVAIELHASAGAAKILQQMQHPTLYRQLVLLRDAICKEENMPIYLVANQKTIVELVNYLPCSNQDLLSISGFGKAKVEAFGERFLKIISEYMANKRPSKVKKEKKNKNDPQGAQSKENDVKRSSFEKTLKMYKEGMRVDEIAKERGLTVGTIQQHLLPSIVSGDIELDDLISSHKQKLIMNALDDFSEEEGITPIKLKLPEDITYSEIRYVLAHKNKVV